MYKMLFLSSFSILSITYLISTGVVRSEEIELPKVYDFHEQQNSPYDELYCRIIIRLKPINESDPPEIWKLIDQKNNAGRRFFRRDVIYRGNCVQKNSSKEKYDEYESHGLMGNVDHYNCVGKTAFSYDGIDVFFGTILSCYVAFLIYSTISAYKAEKNGQRVNKYVEIFSLINIWKDIRKPNRSEDFQRLLSIQGMRTFTMIFIITAHNFTATIFSHSQNPEYLENLYGNSWMLLFIGSFGLSVHTFFVISSWLLAVQLQNIVKKNGKITIKDVFILALNRYFRLIPAVVVTIFLHRSKTAEFTVQPMYSFHMKGEIERCRVAWWRNLLFIQNLEIFDGRICSPGTWYIAADTQMYLLVLILFYLSQKFKISLKYLFIMTASIAICTQSYVVSNAEYDGLFMISPRILPPDSFFSLPELRYSYQSTLPNIPTYLIGYAFGYLYTENKKKNIFGTLIKQVCWFIAFLGCPYLALKLYSYDFSNGLEELIMAVSLRPIFAFGIAVGLLGMSNGIGGFLKSFFESAPLVFLGNFTYSVYMFHFMIVFGRLTSSEKMIIFDNFFFVKNIIIDVVLSFIFGMIMYIIMEHPCIRIQKLILPQVNTKNEEKKEK